MPPFPVNYCLHMHLYILRQNPCSLLILSSTQTHQVQRFFEIIRNLSKPTMTNSVANLALLGFCMLQVMCLLVPQANARAFLVFGDSLVDNGNNDFLITTARADNYPYGIDYPTHLPTGRFSNGLNIPDIISKPSCSPRIFNTQRTLPIQINNI